MLACYLRATFDKMNRSALMRVDSETGKHSKVDKELTGIFENLF